MAKPTSVTVSTRPVGSIPRPIQRVVARGIRGLYAKWSNCGKMAGPVCVMLLTLVLHGCARPSVHEPVTLTLLDEWSNKTFSEARQQELQQFTRETEIRVSLLPSPESARQRLALWKELLGTGASGPDVYGIDVIWPGILNEYFIDLKPYFANEVSLQFPAMTAGYTVDNKLVAIAYRADIRLLYYRTDLLRQYGYREPPRPCDELEIMAARIQARGMGTLGGWSSAVSRCSAHPREALELVRYLTRRDVQVKRSRVLSQPPILPELYNLPEVLEPNPRFDLLSQAFQTGIVLRPSNVTGKKYQDVTDAYMQAVHSVLTGEKSAPEAAAALEKELVRITGFKKRPPLEDQHSKENLRNRSISLAQIGFCFHVVRER